MALIWPYLVLIILGCGWGLTIPLTVISVKTGFGHLGIIFWQFFIIVVVFGLRQIFLNKKLSLARSSLRVFCVIAFIGTIFPNSASLIAASYLPGGILSILIATVPMFAFPIALLFGIDKFGFLRLLGIIFGFLGVYLLIAPKAALPDPSVAWVIPIALIAPMFYGLEGNFVAKFGTGNSSPIEVLLGAFSPLCNTFFFRNTWRSIRNLRLVGYQSGFSILGTSQLFCYFSRSIMVHVDIG